VKIKKLRDIYIILVMDIFTNEIEYLLIEANEASSTLFQELYGKYGDKYTLHFSDLYDELEIILKK
jgi:hypothetical protein